MQTIVAITTKALWGKSQKQGQYARSTITQTLEEVGFIHCTAPDQTMDIVVRFKNEQDVILLLIDASKVTSPIHFEAAKSGRSGLFPHIYGPINLDAVYEVISLQRDKNNDFLTPLALKNLIPGV